MQVPERLLSTVGDLEWLRLNEAELRACFPETWTHAMNINILKLMFDIKVAGIDWRGEDEYKKVLAWMELVGILLRDGLLTKRNPNSIFNSQGVLIALSKCSA